MTKVLIASPFPPDPRGLHGGTQAIGRLMEDLVSEGDCAVSVVFLRADGEPPMSPALAGRCEIVEEVARPAYGLRRQLRLAGALVRGRPMWVEDWSVPAFGERLRGADARWKPDIIQHEFHVMAQYAFPSNARSILVVHEPGAAAARDRYESSRGWRKLALQRDWQAWMRYENEQLAQVDAVVCFTELDRKRLLQLRPGASRIEVIAPRGPAPIEYPSPEQSANILFVGNYIHPPNVDAALRLARSIFPRVRVRHPQAVLQLVGDAPPEELLREAGPGIEIPGRVSDVSPWMQSAAVFVSPMTTGGGIRLKMMDALAYGKAIVATPLSCEGLNLQAGRDVLQAENDAAFADAIGALVADSAQRRSLEVNARASAVRLAATGQGAAKFVRLYESVRKGSV